MGTIRGVGSRGNTVNKDANAPTISEIVITKKNDNSSAGLFKESFQGEGKKVTIDFVTIDGGKFEVYMKIELENVMISSYSISGHGGDIHARPIESISFNFTKITISTPASSKDSKDNKDKVGWDSAVTQTKR